MNNLTFFVFPSGSSAVMLESLEIVGIFPIIYTAIWFIGLVCVTEKPL